MLGILIASHAEGAITQPDCPLSDSVEHTHPQFLRIEYRFS